MSRRVNLGAVFAAALLVAAAAVAAAPPVNRTEERLAEITAANHRAWGAVTMADGLPSDGVNAIAQDADGAIWFGTDHGLAVLDGRGTRVVGLGTEEPASVAAIAPLDDGRILVATDTGLRVVSGTQAAVVPDATTQFSAVAIRGPATGGIVAARSEDGTLWAGGSPEAHLDPILEQPPVDASVLSADDGSADVADMVSRDGEVFVASRHRGLLRFADGRVAEIRSLSAGVTALAVDPSAASIWIGVTNGPRSGAVHRLDRDGRLAMVSTVGGAVTGLAAGESGACWVATDGAGAYLVSDKGSVRHETFNSTIGGLRSDALRCAFTDREGVVWFGGDRGASRFDWRGPETRTVGGDANGDVVRSITHAAGRLWVGTNRGLAAGGSADSLVPVASLDGRTVFDVEVAPDGRLLAATQKGLFAATAADGRLPEFSALETGFESGDLRARAVAVFGGAPYVGTFGAGLLRLDGNDLRPVEFTGAGDSIRDIVGLHVDEDGTMWIGTAGRGAFRCDRAGLTPLDSAALNGRTVYGIAGSGSSTLWFATDAGLVVRDQSAEGRILEDCDVRSVVPVGARAAMCATANRGAVLVSWDERFGWLESHIDEERGLPSDVTFAVDVAPTRDGHSIDALIGTSRGLTTYRTSNSPPVVGVAGALASRQLTPSEIESGIVLAYPQRSVVLELFATGTRTFRGQFQYGYVVSDAGGAAVTHGTVRDGKVSLDRLAPGAYVVDVYAFNNDLAASAKRTVRITVERAPFPWATTGLAALLLFAVLALVWGAVQNRTIARRNAALRAANLELADTRLLVAQETERERSRIARDLHDQTLADLRRLMLLADKLPAPVSDVSPRPGELRQRIEEVSGEIRRICEDLSPSALSNLGLGPALEWLVIQAQSEMPADQRFTASVTFSDRLEERIDPGSDVPIQIYRIVQEAVSNVCRHAKATHVEVDALVDDAGSLTIRVSDDGVGFDESTEPNGSGRGLGNMRWRADMIGATIGWARRPSGGTVVTLARPAGAPGRAPDDDERDGAGSSSQPRRRRSAGD